MGSPIPRRAFLALTLGAAALPLAQACAPQAPVAKPGEPAKPAQSAGAGTAPYAWLDK